MRLLAAASFQPKGEEELELQLGPATNYGFGGVQEVAEGCFQGKVRKAKRGGFVSLPCCGSRLLAAWFVAKALKARHDGMLETSTFMAAMKDDCTLAPPCL